MNNDELLRDNDRLRILNGRLVRLCLDKGMTAKQVDAIAADMDRPLPSLLQLQPTSKGGPAIEAELRRELKEAKRVLQANKDVMRNITVERNDFRTQLAALQGKLAALEQAKPVMSVETVQPDELSSTPEPEPLDPDSDEVFRRPPQRRSFR